MPDLSQTLKPLADSPDSSEPSASPARSVPAAPPGVSAQPLRWGLLALALACGSAAPVQAQEAPRVLLLQEVAPWGSTSNEQVLTAAGVSWQVLHPSQLRRRDLASYAVIVVASDQPQSFYDALAPHIKPLTRWLREGRRTLQFHGAANGWHAGNWTFRLPGGQVYAGYGPDVINIVPRRQGNHPLVTGLFNRLDESQINTVVLLSDPPLGAGRVVMTNRDGQPTLIDYCLGPGRVIASGQQLEAGWAWGHELGRLLENMVWVSTSQPGCSPKP